jgi:crotonobetainyl-CoA:carnitine CoA-transferase CaiB-like acyl-CoA transferase
MGNPAWAADSRFDTTGGRWENRHELEERLGQWTSTQQAQALMGHLQAFWVPAGAVLTAADLVHDSHLQERGYLQAFTNPNAPRVGPRIYAGRPFRMPHIPMAIHRVAALGEHNEQILRELAGLSPAEIKDLADQGVIASRPRPTEPAP